VTALVQLEASVWQISPQRGTICEVTGKLIRFCSICQNSARTQYNWQI